MTLKFTHHVENPMHVIAIAGLANTVLNHPSFSTIRDD